MNAPERIHILTEAAGYGEDQEPLAVKIDGEIIDWANAPIRGDLNRLELNGQPYAYERKYGERVQDGRLYFGHAYRLQVGWQVLTNHDLDARMAPDLQHPTGDRTEAETYAREVVTKNLSAYGTKVKAQVVWQDGEEYGEPVSGIHGENHKRHEAARCILRGEWLPLDWTDKDEAGDAPTSPAPDTSGSSSSSTEEQEPTQDHNTTEPDWSQVERVSRQWGPKPGTDVVIAGRCVAWDDRPFHEVEELVRALGWQSTGKMGGWMNPAFFEAMDRVKQKWEQRLAVMRR